MKVIHKYPIRITAMQEITVLKEQHTTLRVIHAGLDPHGVACIWVEVDTGTYKGSLIVAVVPTGGEVPNGHRHVGSFVDGIHVWHVYT